MYYDIIYKLKGDFEKSNVKSLTYERILDSIKQLNNGISSLGGRLVYGFSNLEELKIIEKNYWDYTNGSYYDFLDNGEHFCLSDLPDEAGWSPEEIDITNKVFLELGIKGDTSNSQIIFFQKGILHIFGKEFVFEKESKIFEILDLYFKTISYFGNEKVSFEQLEEIFKQQNYKVLKVKDLKYESIRSLLKNRMKQISEELGVESILDIKTGYMKIGN